MSVRIAIGPLCPTPTPTITPIYTSTITPTSSPTSSPTSTMTLTPTYTLTFTPTATPISIYSQYLGNFTESQLAFFQQDQGRSNNCAPFAIAQTFNYFYGAKVQGQDIADAINQNWNLLVMLRYRMLPNSAVLPQNQVNIINDISRLGNLGIKAKISNPQPTAMIQNLSDPNKVQLVTFYYVLRVPPEVSKGNSITSGLGKSWLQASGHTMALAAYDPKHVDANGNPKPWGFINSWDTGGVTGSTEIYWVSDADMIYHGYDVVLVEKK